MSESKIDKKDSDKIDNYIVETVNKMIEKANVMYRNRPESVSLPLIRLKIENTGYDVVRISKLEPYFKGKIANIKDFLQFYKRQVTHKSYHNLIEDHKSNLKRPNGDSILEDIEKLQNNDQAMFQDVDENKQLLHNMVSKL